MKTSKSKIFKERNKQLKTSQDFLNVLANVGQDDDQHLEADIPMSVVPKDAADDMEQKTAMQGCGTHNIVHECVTRSRDAKELTTEDTTSLELLAMEF